MTVDELIAEIKRSTQHIYLYHFTDKSNLESINIKGLLSKEQMRAEGWWPERTGGNELSHSLDTYRGIDPFVSLCMTQNHPMKFTACSTGSLSEPVYLAIQPEILKTPGAKMAFGVANANGTEILLLEEALDKLDTEVIYRRTNWADPDVNQRLRVAEKYEILIPGAVPRDLIAGTC